MNWADIKTVKPKKNYNELMGRHTPIDLNRCEEIFSKWLSLSNIEISDPTTSDLESLNLYHTSDSATPSLINTSDLILSLPPLEGHAYIVLSPTFRSSFLASNFAAIEAPTSVMEGFWQFCIAKGLQHINSIEPFHHFEITSQQADHVQEEPGEYISFTVRMNLSDEPYEFKVVLSPLFQFSWKDFWQSKQIDRPSNLLAEKKFFRLNACVGEINMSTSQISNLEIGDWVLLDHHFFDNNLSASQVDLYLDQHKRAQGNLKNGEIEITSCENFDNES